MSLIEKIRKAREVTVEAGGHVFTIKRPTDEEALQMSRADEDMVSIVKRFVIGWNLTEIDLIPGGSAIAVPFDGLLFAEWVADHPAVWDPLGDAILEAYKVHTQKRDEAVKN